MRIALYAVLALGGCVNVLDQPELLPGFAKSTEAIEFADKAGRQCQVRDGQIDFFDLRNAPPNQCLGHNIEYDRAACQRFDEAIQVAAEPLSICSDEDALSQNAKLHQRCKIYLDEFWTPCVGIQAYSLAHKERAASQAYRRAINNGMTEERAHELHLSEIVRYRE